MKKIGKLLLILIGLLILVGGSALAYVKLALPDVGNAQVIHINADAAMIERGDYLANHLMVCMDCHSERDWSKFSGPLVPGTLGKGGEVFNHDLGFPGVFLSKNITPYNLKDWTDGEIMRAISTGVSKDGEALFPIMPYSHYGKLDQRDVEAVIAYLRTLPSIEAEHAQSEADFPMNFIINTIPQKAAFGQRPNPEDKLAYGEYLMNAAACYDCHTRQEKGQFVGKDFAGGMEFKLVDGSIVRSSNITPHLETGLGNWTEAQFVERFKLYGDSAFVPHEVTKGDFQTIMPWTMYGGLEERDLKAMFAYLQSLEAVENTVVRFTEPGT